MKSGNTTECGSNFNCDKYQRCECTKPNDNIVCKCETLTNTTGTAPSISSTSARSTFDTTTSIGSKTNATLITSSKANTTRPAPIISSTRARSTFNTTNETLITSSKEATTRRIIATSGGPIANSTQQTSSSETLVDQTQVDDSGLPISTIAGVSAGIIGIVIVAVVVIVVLVCLRRRRKKDEKPSQPSAYDDVLDPALRLGPLYDDVMVEYLYAEVCNNPIEGGSENNVTYSQVEEVEKKNTHPVYDTVYSKVDKTFPENNQNHVYKAYSNSIIEPRNDKYSQVAKPSPRNTTYDVTYDGVKSDHIYDRSNCKIRGETCATYDITAGGT